jgi:phage/plasmid-like protein (TIGR03299 family)
MTNLTTRTTSPENSGWRASGALVNLNTHNAEEAMHEAGLAWRVKKTSLYYEDANSCGDLILDKDNVAIVRESDNKRLGIVGAGYTPIQNVEAFSFMDELAAKGKISYEAAGTFRKDRSVWMFAKLQEHEIVKNDPLKQYLLLYNSHDSASSLRVTLTHLRIACTNAIMSVLNRSKENEVRIRHSKNAKENMIQAVEAFERLHGRADETANLMRGMAKIRFDSTKLENFVTKLFPDPPAELRTDRKMANLEEKRGDVISLYYQGRGQNIPGVEETGWAAFNAVTEYFNHHVKTRGENESQKRLENVLFGPAAKTIHKASRLIMQAA